METCPECGRPGLSAWRIGLSSPLLPVRCSHCGAGFFAPMGFKSWWVNGPVILAVVAVVLFALPLAQGFGLSVLVLVAAVWALSGPRQLIAMPRSPRDG